MMEETMMEEVGRGILEASSFAQSKVNDGRGPLYVGADSKSDQLSENKNIQRCLPPRRQSAKDERYVAR